MTSINISLSQKLKAAAETLIAEGHYASLSDLVRDAIKQVIQKNKYDSMADQAKKELKSGEALVLKDKSDIDNYLKNL